MKQVFLSLVGTMLLSVNTDAAACDSVWAPYKDELCIKAFDDVVSYDDAKAFCDAQSDPTAKASLVMVKEAELQDFLSNYTDNIYDNTWLGGKNDSATGQFTWDDGEPLGYTNWHEGYPRNTTEIPYCMELRPVNARGTTNSAAKWADANCQSRKLVMCQKDPSWTLQDAIAEIIKIRKQLENATEELNDLREELESTNSRVVPVGSIYIEYSGQPSPAALWPSLTWQDISGTYAGLFFRTIGSGSAEWGETQTGCSPRISQMSYTEKTNAYYPNPMNIPENGWSDFGHTGYWYHLWGDWSGEGMRFHTAGCEVRPKNQAIRIWKRTA